MAYTCPVCHRTSHNPQDEVHRYCANCKKFEEDMDLAPAQPLICLIPQRHDGMPAEVNKAARAAVSVRHTPYECPSCQRPCWIGPAQREFLEAGGTADAMCTICLVSRVENDPQLRWALDHVVALNPGIDQEPRRFP